MFQLNQQNIFFWARSGLMFLQFTQDPWQLLKQLHGMQKPNIFSERGEHRLLGMITALVSPVVP